MSRPDKASQNSDMPTKIIKENSDIFSTFLCTSFKSSIKTSKFPQCLKLADIRPLYKKGKNDQKELPICRKFSKCVFLNKCLKYSTVSVTITGKMEKFC